MRAMPVVPAFAALFCVVSLSPASADWGNSRGGPERDGARVGVADLRAAQVAWRHRLGGSLGSSAMWSFADPIVPRIASVYGGRMSLKRWDDTSSWQGDLHGVTTIQAALDIDADNEVDLLLASGTQNGDVLIGYTPEGVAAFTAPAELLGPITTGVRTVDLDGDGTRELYVAPFRAGPSGPIVAAFRFPNGAGSGELMYTIDASHRDYFGGFYDVIAELDGTPGLEIMALGRRRIYVYDAATGVLESESDDLGPIPLARATLRAVDVDGDGVSEVFGFSNQNWSEVNNRRHLTLFGHDGTKVVERWRRDVDDVVNDRVAFSDSSVTDLDGDGQLEVAFAFYRAASDSWTTEVLDAATGTLLDNIPNERFRDVATDLFGGVSLFTHDDGEPLRAYRYSRGPGLIQTGTAPDLKLMRCRVQTLSQPEAARARPCQSAPGVVLAAEYEPESGRLVSLNALDTQASLSQVARFDGSGGFITGVIEIGPTQPAVIAVAHTDGIVIPLDSNLRRLPPSPKPPFAWGGIQFGTSFSGTDVAAFPLVIPGSPGQPERILAIAGGGRALALDASNDPSVVGGAEVSWSHPGASRAVVSASGVALFDSVTGITGIDPGDGSQLWRVPDYFGPIAGLHLDPLHVLRDGTDELWFHRRHNTEGRYDLTVLDAATGQTLSLEPSLDINDSGWRRLSLALEAGEPTPQSGRLDQVWRYGPGGVVASTHDTGQTQIIALPVPLATGALQLHVGPRELSAYDTSTDSVVWTRAHQNTLRTRLGAMLNVGGVAHYATGANGSPTFTVLNAETGELVSEFNLIDGEVRDLAAPVPTPPPALSNMTALSDLTGDSEPAYLVGSSDGFIYAINALDHSLVWSLDVEASVGEVVPADWDGDGRMELVASTADGAIVGVDTFNGDAPEWVYDTDGVVEADIDELATNRTLYASWAAVEGATGYQLAVFTNDGQPVTADFGSVGNVTSAIISNLQLEAGVRYVVAVRAVSDLGTSTDTASDGVTVLVRTDRSGGCCQVSGGAGQAASSLVLVLLCAVLCRRRRRR